DQALSKVDQQVPFVKKPTNELYAGAKGIIALPFKTGDWLVGTANDQIACIDDSEEENKMAYLSNFRQKFETVVSPAYMERANGEILALRDGYVDFSTWCITKFVQLIFVIDFKLVMPDFFTPKWYGSSAMKQMVVTFE
ncbi:hypothetical protein BN1723_017510, partial [Verticillium longisporum]